jgi:diguanylate cyclase (GGDEF)-like protein
VLETGKGVFNNHGEIEALEGIIIDITESKKKQFQMDCCNDHDFMTGLFNRSYYETKKMAFEQSGTVPISILIIDINGLKTMNDSFGLAEGDHIIIATANILKRYFLEGALLSRTGGDDFKMIFPNTGSEKATKILQNIKDHFEKANRDILEEEKRYTITIGFSTKISKDESLDKIEKEAEDHLRTRKLFAQKSHYHSLINSIMTTLYVRSRETEAHSKRIYKISKMIANKISLPMNDLNDLHLFSMLHDIGKVGIDDRILNKPGKLSQEEWDIMKTHSELGYQIAMSVPEFANVADCILTHHERWDGKGYPNSLTGKNMPLLSRILAVADAYDAMTENRVYRPALTEERALEEIRKNAGTQFDPNIASAFLELMLRSKSH